MHPLARRAIWLLAILSIASLLAACAAPRSASEPMAPAAAPTSAPAAALAGNSYGALSDKQAESEGKQSAPTGSSGQVPTEAPPWDRMVIRTSNVAMTVSDVEQTLASIRDIAQATESFVASSQTQYVGDKMSASVTLQVPAQSFDSVIQQVRKLAVKVDSEQTSSQDVTEEYVDLQSRINNLKATEQSTVRLLDKATRMDEILTIQRELTTIRGQIEQAQGRVNYLQRRSDYSTLMVRLAPVGAATDPFSSPSWQPLQTITRAWQASLEAVSTIVDILLSVVVFLWWLIPIVAVGIWLWRRRRRSRARASTPAGTPPPAST